MKQKIIVDTGVFVALFIEKDAHHQRCLDCTKNLQGEFSFITTWPVVTEAVHFLSGRAPHRVGSFMQLCHDESFEIFGLHQSDIPAMITLMKKYADLPMDLADASLVILAEALGHGNIISTDERDFEAYKWKRQKPFKNLLL